MSDETAERLQASRALVRAAKVKLKEQAAKIKELRAGVSYLNKCECEALELLSTAQERIRELEVDVDAITDTSNENFRLLLDSQERIRVLKEALRGVIDANAIPSSACKGRPAYDAALAALNPTEPT